MDASWFHTLAEQAKASPPWADPRFPPSLYYRFLRVLAANHHPHLSVELGTCGGGAAFYMCIGCPAGQVVSVDHSYEYPDNVAYIECQCPNFTFLRGDSIDLAPEIGNRGLIDLLFIDTVHTYERTLAEFNAYHPYLSNRAIVILDDLYREGMDRAWAELSGNKLRLDKLHIGGSETDGGFGVIWNILSFHRRPWKD